MPFSLNTGKAFIALALNRLNRNRTVGNVVDVGPGLGTFGRLLRPILPSARFAGVEVWAPYISRYGLEAVYDRVVVCDVRHFRFEAQDAFSVAIFGDVLEHITPDEAQDALLRAVLSCDVVVVSIPIGMWPQDEYEGNPYEAHVGSWSLEAVKARFPFLASEAVFRFTNDTGIGIFAMARRPDLRSVVNGCFNDAAACIKTAPELQGTNLSDLPDYSDPAQVSGFQETLRPYLV